MWIRTLCVVVCAAFSYGSSHLFEQKLNRSRPKINRYCDNTQLHSHPKNTSLLHFVPRSKCFSRAALSAKTENHSLFHIFMRQTIVLFALVEEPTKISMRSKFEQTVKPIRKLRKLFVSTACSFADTQEKSESV